MRRAGFRIVILVCEYAVSSLVTEQERAGNRITVNGLSFIDSIDILQTILILTETRDKVRLFSAQYGTGNYVSKYGTIPFF